MDRELDCEIVKDLLPLYVDGMVSDVSKRSIEKHMEHCKECKETFDRMAFGLEPDEKPPEGLEVKKFLRKTKKMYFFYGLGGVSFVAAFVCFIVDLALHRRITWSLITGCAIAFADVLVYSFLESKKNRGCHVMAVISIGVTCLLSAIQISRYCLMHAGTIWIFRYGFPIMLLWLAVLWLPVLLRYILKWNIWDCLAVLMAMLIVGNYATRLITGDYGWEDIGSLYIFMSNAFGELIGLILFVIIGRIKKWRK